MSEPVIDTPDSAASSPGAILKRCREYHQISLDDAAEATKIGVNYLTALENDKVSGFASPAYLKGFLRIYANHLGLNADDMVRLYDKLYSQPDPDQNNSSSTHTNTLDQRKRFPWQKLTLPAVVLFLLIATSLFLSRSHTSVKPVAPKPATPTPAAIQQQASSAVQQAVVPPQKIEQEAPPTKRAKTEEPVSDAPTAQKPAPEPTKGFMVRMRVTQNGKLVAIIDGATPQTYELNSGEIIEWKVESSIALELSNAGGVEAELNGKPLKSFGAAGKSTYVVLDSNGVRP